SHVGNDVGGGERFAAAGHSQERLMILPALKARDNLVDGLGLVARRLKIAGDCKVRRHGRPSGTSPAFGSSIPSLSFRGEALLLVLPTSSLSDCARDCPRRDVPAQM